MNKKNDNVESLKTTYIKAFQYFKKKDFKNAEVLCFKILNIDPYHFDSLLLLSSISGVTRNFNQAKDLLTKAVEIKPTNTAAIHNLATSYKELGKIEDAKKYYNKVLEIDSNHTNANYNLGVIFYQAKELSIAKNYLKKTTEVQKNFGLAFFTLGNVHSDLREYNEALSCYQKAIEINPNIVGAHNNLGLIFRTLNDFENAINCYKKAIDLQPQNGGAYHNLALAYKELGQFDKSIESHKKAIEYEKNNLAHYYYLSELKKEILDSNLKKKINEIIKDTKLTPHNNAFGNYLLAKYEEKSKDYEKEFELLVEGHKNFYNTRKKKFDLGIKYCFDDVLQIYNGIDVKKINQSYNEIKPIFIIGVPRCGSTLVEKIITSGTKFISIGEETSVFENFVNKRILEKQSLNLGDSVDITNELKKIYKERGLLSEKNNFIFTDKSLNNFFYLNLINKIYPNAKIINCKRDVLSSIMSIFKNNLSELAWTHDINNILKYFDNYFKIINEFKKNNSSKIYELEFEKLANDPEKESKKVMDYCELPWNKKCLEFYKRKDLISKTASNVQIRKAVYKHSLERYLPYKKFLMKYAEKKYSWFN